ncbi:MAG: hypothetical protein K1X89_27700, partial [Myxococcaceae bacterium]|nr:hypothetical protein [Myxococcaceae bacterium]
MSRRRRELWLALGGLAFGLLFVHRAVLSGQLHAGRDLFQIFIPETQYLLERWSALEVPWWTTRVRLGQPFAATLYAQALYPPRVIPALLLGAAGGVTGSIVFHGALAAAGAFWAARVMGARPLAASLAGLFGLAPWFVRLSCALHVVSALAWAPVAVAAAVRLSREPGPRRAAWLAAAFGALLFAGCPEVALWLFPLCAVIAGRRALGWWALSAALAVLLALVLYLPAAELWLQSERGAGPVADQLQWSASVPQLLSLGALNADFPVGPYFGADQWFTTSLFVGAVPCALALLSLRRRRAWALAALGAVGGLLVLGARFAPAAAVLSVPPLAWFRYPVKYAFALALCVALLAPLGARELVVLMRRRPASLRGWAAGLVAVLVALAAIPALVGLGPWRAGLSAGAFWAVGVAGVGGWLAWSPLLGSARARLRLVAALEV